MKACPKCGETKPTAEFYKDSIKSDGLSSSCKECTKIAVAAYRVAFPDKVKAVQKAWYAVNADIAKERDAKWRAANREKKKAYDAKWVAANRDKHNAQNAKWAAAHPEASRIHCHNRRARERASGGTLSKGLAEKLFKLQRGKCACGCKQPLGEDYHLDHRMPLALGGANEDWNMQLLTKTCNLQKHAKHPVEFMQQRGYLL